MVFVAFVVSWIAAEVAQRILRHSAAVVEKKAPFVPECSVVVPSEPGDP